VWWERIVKIIQCVTQMWQRLGVGLLFWTTLYISWTYHLEQFTWISAWSWTFSRQF